jgi:trk system potassium uptake protein TrkA
MAMNVVIVGGGRVGAYLAALLLASGHRVTVIEASEAELTRLRRDLPPEVVRLGSGTDPAALEAAGIRQAQVVAAVTGLDETNLVVAGLARFAFGAPRTIARVNDPGHAWLFTPAMGVDVALNQAELLGHLIAEEMSLGDMLTLLKLRKGQYALVEERVHPLAAATDRPLGDLALPAECALAAVIRGGRLLIPRADLVLRPADEVLAVVHAAHAADLAALLGPPGASAQATSGPD